ncbi:hypothetical protein J6590_093018 [Homalodisca vitripennis]|nr:hypothetical protein J6590_093018 [Homalodisca vitripennis]
MAHRDGGDPLVLKAIIDKPFAKKPAQKQISEQRRAARPPSNGGECDKHLLPSILSARKIFIEQTYVAIDVSRSFRFDVGLAAQWLGHGIEQAGECRAVVGILEERRRGLYPTLRELKPPSVFL